MAENATTSEVDFDIIVIGAGIAGCVTAYLLAKKGHSVLLAERGTTPGSKNLSGGILYCRVMNEIFPDFIKEAPVERIITRNCLSFLSAESFVNIDYGDKRLDSSPTAVSVLRAKLDEWLGSKCEEAGVTLMSGIRVDSLVKQGDQIIGIRADKDELTCHVVVAADGVNSFICRNAGIRVKESEKNLAVGIKSVIRLPKETIEERFNLTGNQGAAYAVVGDCTNGLGGGGFLYTNLESLSIGVVVRLDELAASNESSSDLHDRFLSHPAILPLINGGELLEYGCHMVAEGGLAMVHDLVRPGLIVVGDAAGLTLNTGLTVRGMDLAVGSAIAAAAVICEALAHGDFSMAALEQYSQELTKSFVGKDMKTYARAPKFLENPRMYGEYGKLLSNILYGVFNLDTTPRQKLFACARNAFKNSPINILQLISDGFGAMRSI